MNHWRRALTPISPQQSPCLGKRRGFGTGIHPPAGEGRLCHSPCTSLWASCNDASKNHLIPGAEGGGRKKKHQKREVIKESKQHTTEPSVLAVSRRGPGRAGGAYLQLGLNLTRFPPGKNLQVARDLQRESRRGGTAEPSTRGEQEEGEGCPCSQTPPQTLGTGGDLP